MCLINILSLKRRTDRRQSVAAHLDEWGCLYRFWDAPDDRSIMPFVNISRGHKSIVSHAKRRGYNSVLIGEDDLRFSCKNSLPYFLLNIPDSYDLYFGVLYTATIQDGRVTNGFSGLQFYSISSKFYDTFLSAPENRHLDQWLGSQCYKYEFFCSDPFVAFGESGYSNNFHKQWVFKEENLPRKLLK